MPIWPSARCRRQILARVGSRERVARSSHVCEYFRASLTSSMAYFGSFGVKLEADINRTTALRILHVAAVIIAIWPHAPDDC